MGSWNEVLGEINSRLPEDPEAIDTVRKMYIRRLSSVTGRNVICYYSAWLQNPLDQTVPIADDDMNGFMNAVYGMDRTKGLDLVLHTPGGSISATEAIVSYLRSCFGTDIRAVIPQLAMSAGTMMACACKEIVMGRQSSLGPTDPQLGGVSAGGVIEEFDRAVRDVQENPASAAVWGQIISKYHPTFLGDCQKALDASKEMLRGWLAEGMLDGDLEAANKAIALLCDHSRTAMHDRHFDAEAVRSMGLAVTPLEEDSAMQDAVLSVHHAYMCTFAATPTSKIVEGSTGDCSGWIKFTRAVPV